MCIYLLLGFWSACLMSVSGSPFLISKRSNIPVYCSFSDNFCWNMTHAPLNTRITLLGNDLGRGFTGYLSSSVYITIQSILHPPMISNNFSSVCARLSNVYDVGIWLRGSPWMVQLMVGSHYCRLPYSEPWIKFSFVHHVQVSFE